MKICNHFIDLWNKNTLPNTSCISSYNLDDALLNIEDFTKKILNINDLEFHPDVQIIKPEKTTINIDQIRNIKQFAHQTSKAKVIIIYSADNMTINAYNSCLKILEDTPQNTFFFLLVNSMKKLPLTILSRCYKFSDYNYQVHDIDNKFYDKILNCIISNQIPEIKSEEWSIFAQSILNLLSKITKKHLKVSIELSEQEKKISEKSSKAKVWLEKYKSTNALLNEAKDHHLNLEHITILIMETIWQ